jgi:hypothetical protein
MYMILPAIRQPARTATTKKRGLIARAVLLLKQNGPQVSAYGPDRYPTKSARIARA